MLRDVYYGYNINITNTVSTKTDQLQIRNMYDTTKLSSNEKGIVSKSYSYVNLKENKREVLRSPPAGPIKEYTKCLHCVQQGPLYHLESCPGPYVDEVLTYEGILFYQDKIKETEIVLQEDSDIYYRDLFPYRGKQLLESDQYKIAFFPNVLQYKYVTPPVGTDKGFSADHPHGMIITVKVSPNLGVSFKNIPLLSTNTVDTIPHDIFKSIFRNKSIDTSYVTNMNCTVRISDKQNFILDEINDLLHNIQFGEKIYKPAGGVIDIKLEYSKLNISLRINRGSSVQMYFSNKSDKSQTVTREKLEDFKLYMMGKIKFENYLVDKISKKGIKYDKKIMNTLFQDYKTLPATKKTFPPQPSNCMNSISSLDSVTKSSIRRPYPYSFSQGKPPCKGLVLRSGGVLSKSKSSILGNLEYLYEPCTECIIGTCKDKSITFYNDFNFITNLQLDKFLDSTKSIRELSPDEIINSSTSVNESILRHIYYGFPNNKHSDDFKENNNIMEGIESVPILDKDEIYTPSAKFKNIKQEDIMNAVYIPGTQLKNFYGDNTFVRDTRIFEGILSRNKQDLIFIIEHYLKTHLISDKSSNNSDKITPLHMNNIRVIKEELSAGKLQQEINGVFRTIYEIENTEAPFRISNGDIYIWKNNEDVMKYTKFRFKIKKVSDDRVRIHFPESGDIPKVELFNETDLFIPKSQLKKLKDNHIYMFSFNYYIDTTGEFNLIPNQPFSHVDEYDEYLDESYQKNIIDSVYNPLVFSDFSE